MNIQDEINMYIEQIDKLGFEKKLNLNSKQTAEILGVSPSSVEAWRKQGIGVDYIEVGGRILYPKLKIAEFQVMRKIKTA
ncbi:helix-turn-helix domain-containing protein [Aliarcobacter butzleri]|uniref:Helix-turn-helix domain-containing protein n=1 Tax=Aliarcobacter butzleri TaxID=28197 RepID=A0AAW7PW02_9BACT|nr:helix-turn-helix domain-containing protein [Aliarcobacter butzleri]MCG3667509.1 helix-turn-helix domain-containing protein [Aliarcobacter butzleri]MDN5069912.1 helix-turn-helix domain-containing protein [Aliarcobacter butzleri]